MVVAIILAVVLIPCVFIVQVVRKLFSKDLGELFFCIALGVDQLGSSVLYLKEDWTISSRTHFLAKYRHNKSAMIFENIINVFFGKNHCQLSYTWERDAGKLDGAGSGRNRSKN